MTKRIIGLLMAVALAGCQPATEPETTVTIEPVIEETYIKPEGLEKVTFDLSVFDEDGLYGPTDGKQSQAYEFCVPVNPMHLREVKQIDPTANAFTGSPARIGCGERQYLFIGETHQPQFINTLQRLAALEYVTEIAANHHE